MPDTTLFHGLSAFPLTPADDQGRVDTDTLARLIGRLCEAGVNSIGLLGSTGVYAYLTREEERRRSRGGAAVAAAVECVGGQAPLIGGVGAPRADQAQALARDAEAAGADGLLLAPVSYTPLTQDEAYEQTIAYDRFPGSREAVKRSVVRPRRQSRTGRYESWHRRRRPTER